MTLADDIEQAQVEGAQAVKERTVFPGTISTVTPLTVILDGSGVAVPCLNFAMLPVKESRRVGVIKLGSDYVLFGTFGSNILTDLTLDGDLSIGDDLTVTGDIFWGGSTAVWDQHTAAVSHLSATFVYTGLWIAFQAPPSGKVNIHWSGKMKTVVLNSFCWISFELRDGVVNGSGSVITSASTSSSIELRGFANQEAQYGMSKLAVGLTPNAGYHVRLMHASSDTTGVNESSNMDVHVTMEI
jgi:hypothetical protein